MKTKEKKNNKNYTPIFHLQCLSSWKDLYNGGSIQIRNYANQVSNLHYNFPKKVFFPQYLLITRKHKL